jgi:3'(2'), 5'-bisphosphate nucleotidase
MSIEAVIEIAVEAGERILEIYESGVFGIESKADDSPLTTADRESHKIINEGLEKDFPEIPVLSEEGLDIPVEERMRWDRFWLVDPLDGTKEFIGGNGEFTVNIALIENNNPVAGVIYAPVLSTIYFAAEKGDAYRMRIGEKPVGIAADRDPAGGLVAVRSRSHSSEEEEELISSLNVTGSMSVGSSLKFCMVAEGRAHVYYRHGPTWEWDTAAGQAIAERAGAVVYGLGYNKEVVKNGPFIVSSVGVDLPSKP